MEDAYFVGTPAAPVPSSPGLKRPLRRDDPPPPRDLLSPSLPSRRSIPIARGTRNRGEETFGCWNWARDGLLPANGLGVRPRTLRPVVWLDDATPPPAGSRRAFFVSDSGVAPEGTTEVFAATAIPRRGPGRPFTGSRRPSHVAPRGLRVPAPGARLPAGRTTDASRHGHGQC